MGTFIKVQITDEFFESLFKESETSTRCIDGIPKEAKLMEIKPNRDGTYIALFQLPEQMEITPRFETRT